jgi:hypothetical protein
MNSTTAPRARRRSASGPAARAAPGAPGCGPIGYGLNLVNGVDREAVLFFGIGQGATPLISHYSKFRLASHLYVLVRDAPIRKNF